MLRLTETGIDRSVTAIGESFKAVCDEFFKLGYEVTNGSCAMALSVLHGFRVGKLSGRPTRSRYASSRTMGPVVQGSRRERASSLENRPRVEVEDSVSASDVGTIDGGVGSGFLSDWTTTQDNLGANDANLSAFGALWDATIESSSHQESDDRDNAPINRDSGLDAHSSQAKLEENSHKIERSRSLVEIRSINREREEAKANNPNHNGNHGSSSSSKRRNRLLKFEIGSVEFSAATDAFLPQDIVSKSTGLIEDLHTASLVNVEKATNWLRSLNHDMFIWLNGHNITLSVSINALRPMNLAKVAWRSGKALVSALWIKNIYSKFNALSYSLAHSLLSTLRELGTVDNRSIHDVVKEAGYEYEIYETQTDDGFLLPLERIPNKSAKHVVLLEHGVIDSNFCWVANGTTGSLAFKMNDMGYDVWLGGLRGTGGRRHIDEEVAQDDSKFWDWNVNHHAFLDIPSFVHKIREVKKKELRENANDHDHVDDNDNSIRISGVGHSMGAAAYLMYVVMQNYKKQPHYLDRCILLSPAGIHEAAPLVASILGPVVEYVISSFAYSFRFPTDQSRWVFSKVIEDVRQIPALADVFSLLVGGFMGSRALYEPGLHSVPNVSHHIMSGTSMGVFKFFWTNFKVHGGKKFLAYDYGPEKNMREYGSSVPFDFIAHYNLIDIPMFFTMGLRDNVIHPANIIRHFEALHQHHPELAFLKAMDSGHVDFTLGGEWRDFENLFEWVSTALVQPSAQAANVHDTDDH